MTNRATHVANAAGWRAELSGEEPTGIYWDRQTLHTRTSILLSLRLQNNQNQTRLSRILWRILDLDGREVWRRENSFVVGAKRLLHRRELFEAKLRGAYLLRVEVKSSGATTQKSGRDVVVELPFALSMTPTSGFRPRSFFGINAPALLSRDELDFYARIGARVLRSPWLPVNAGESTALNNALQARLERNLATVGVLRPTTPNRPGRALSVNVASSDSAATAVESWPQQLLAPMARWPLVSRWEIGGLGLAQRRANLELIVQNFQIARVPPGAVTFNLSDETVPHLNLAKLNADWAIAERWPTTWPAFAAQNSEELHPVAAHRLLAQSKEAAQRSLHIVDDSNRQSAPGSAERIRAGRWATRYLTGVMAGAASFSSSLEDETSASLQSTLRRVSRVTGEDSTQTLQHFARGAAFSTMTRTLEDTAFVGEVFPSSPLLWGALFHGQNENVLAIWTAPHQDGQPVRGFLKLRIPIGSPKAATPVRVLDLYGNEQAKTQERDVSIAIGPEPVYVITARSADALRAAGRDATLAQVAPVAVQVLPLTQGFPAAAQVVRVRVQNVAPQSISGQLQIVPPSNWKLQTDTLPLRLEVGQERVINFVATQAAPARDGNYDFHIVVRSSAGSLRRRQTLKVTTATNWRFGQNVRVDGNLTEWRDANWLAGAGWGDSATFDSRVVAPARVALRWDATRVYIAAKIIEPRLRVRRAESTSYPFWRGYDALQLGFGVRDAAANSPKYFEKTTTSAVRDTDYGILLCPFGARTNGTIEGRVLWLWNPSLPFGAKLDPLRWGGVVAGSVCAVRRDERAGVTSYEAAFPISQMRELRPVARALSSEANADDAGAAQLALAEKPVRFGWIAHDDTLPARLWPTPNSTLPWELGTSAFLPDDGAFPTSTAMLGWTMRGRLASDATLRSGAAQSQTNRTRTPIPANTPSPSASTPSPVRARPTPTSTPRPTEAPARRFSTPEVLPMPPSILPPAAPPPGEQIAPRLPS